MEDERTLAAIGEMSSAIDGSGHLSESLFDDDRATIGRLELLVENRFRRVWNSQAFAEDIERVRRGMMPTYFCAEITFAARCAREMSPLVADGYRWVRSSNEGNILSGSDLAEAVQKRETFIHDFSARFGAPPEYILHYTACGKEQSAFYDTEAWEHRAKSVRVLFGGGKCESCGRNDVALHVHHDEPIYTMFTEYFRKNFEIDRMRVWCRSCHDGFHSNRRRQHRSFVIADDKLRKHREAVACAHDKSEMCAFCYGPDSVSDVCRLSDWRDRDQRVFDEIY